jgi:hypothetical protein
MSIGLRANGNSIRLPRPLKVLTPEQVAEIDRALEEVGPFGEVRLVKAKGESALHPAAGEPGTAARGGGRGRVTALRGSPPPGCASGLPDTEFGVS